MIRVKYILVFTAALILGSAAAQPTYNFSDYPKIGEQVVLQSYDAENVNPGNGGANYSWDFSQITNLGQPQSGMGLSVSSTGHAANFPSANMAIGGNNTFQFFNISTAGVTYLGFAQGNDLIQYSNPEVLHTFPISFGYTHNDHFEGTANTDQGTFIRKGDIQVEADGWGTLITPVGTFTNVLRLKSQEIYTDSVSSDGLLYKVYLYSWIKPGVKGSLFTYTKTEIYYHESLINESITGTYNVTQGLSTRTALQTGMDFKVYPNPAISQSTLEIPVGKAGEAVARIFDMTGKEMFVQQVNLAQGVQKVALDLQGIRPGLYLVEIKTANGLGRKQLVIQ